jgi:hypothetical protein
MAAASAARCAMRGASGNRLLVQQALKVPTEIEQDAYAILELLVEARNRSDSAGNIDQISGAMTGPELAQSLGLPAERINDAVSLLEINGYVERLRTFGTAPFDFREVEATPLGRLEHQRSNLNIDDTSRDESPGRALPRYPVPVGSPYGFEAEDWEYVESQRAARDVLKVVLGHQFESTLFDRASLVEMLETDFRRAVDDYNSEAGHESVALNFRPLQAGYGEHLFNEIARDVISADIAVFETSDLNPNVMIEMGVALTWGVRVLPVKRQEHPKPPSDISGQTWANYDADSYTFVDPEHHAKVLAMTRRAMRRKTGTPG